MWTTRCPAGTTAGAEVALGQQRAAGDRRLWLTAQLKGLLTTAQNRGLEQGLATGQGAWGARGAPCCRHSLTASLNPPGVGPPRGCGSPPSSTCRPLT